MSRVPALVLAGAAAVLTLSACGTTVTRQVPGPVVTHTVTRTVQAKPVIRTRTVTKQQGVPCVQVNGAVEPAAGAAVGSAQVKSCTVAVQPDTPASDGDQLVLTAPDGSKTSYQLAAASTQAAATGDQPQYPQWSTPGQVVPPDLQPYVPSVNGATRFTIVSCTAYQCTGIPTAGPDGSTCGEVHDGEQVCEA